MRASSLRVVALVVALAALPACGGDEIELCEDCFPTPTRTTTPVPSVTPTGPTPTVTADTGPTVTVGTPATSPTVTTP